MCVWVGAGQRPSTPAARRTRWVNLLQLCPRWVWGSPQAAARRWVYKPSTDEGGRPSCAHTAAQTQHLPGPGRLTEEKGEITVSPRYFVSWRPAGEEDEGASDTSSWQALLAATSPDLRPSGRAAARGWTLQLPLREAWPGEGLLTGAQPPAPAWLCTADPGGQRPGPRPGTRALPQGLQHPRPPEAGSPTVRGSQEESGEGRELRWPRCPGEVTTRTLGQPQPTGGFPGILLALTSLFSLSAENGSWFCLRRSPKHQALLSGEGPDEELGS